MESSNLNPKPEISVVIPVYRAEKIIGELMQRLEKVLSGLTDRFEVVLVDDRSPDASWEVMKQLASEYPFVLAVRLSRNFGQRYALTSGFRLACGEWVVNMDCDLQDPPEAIPALYKQALHGSDIVLVRRQHRTDSFIKRTGSALFYRFFAVLSGYQMDSAVGSFRIMRWTVVQAFNSMSESFRLIGGMIHWLGFSTSYLDVPHGERYEGKSGYSLRKSMKLALDGIISFSDRPLYFAIASGIIISTLAAFYGFYLIYHYFFVSQFGVSGWLSMVAITSFLSGMILFTLGILGLYIGRIYDQTKRRPLYVVDEAVVGSGIQHHEPPLTEWRISNSNN